MKKGVILFISAVIVGLLMLGIYIKQTIVHPIKGEKEVAIVVKEGETLYHVLSNLKAQGKVKNINILKFYIKQKNIEAQIKPGKHIISNDMSLAEVIKSLGKSTISDDTIKVTIPEGYDIKGIAKLLQDKGIISSKQFLEAVKQYQLPEYIKKEEKRRYALEGYLFPETYHFQKEISGKKIIELMLKQFEAVMKSVEKEHPIKEKSIDDVITMASIIEKEVSAKEEKEKASSVFYNRLEKKMPLQSCATVIYALGEHREKLYNKDLQIKSPYNTYKVPSLPIGPICSPGKASILAAIEPLETEYLYFVSNNDGTHFFTKDYEEFLRVKEVTQGF